MSEISINLHDTETSNRSIRYKTHSVTQSCASLHDILEQEESEFELLKHSQMYGSAQKQEMKKLNVKLEEYMSLNNELDKDIFELTAKIKKTKHNINNQDDDVEKKLAFIRNKQIEVFKLRNSQVEEEIELNKRKAKIEAIDEQLARYDQERKELELKLSNVSNDIRDCESEIQSDQAEIERIKPEREEMEKERRRRAIKHDQEIRILLAGRKKFSVLSDEEITENIDFAKIKWNKKFSESVTDSAIDIKIKALEKKIWLAREESVKLDKEVMVLSREKVTLELDVKRLESELRHVAQNCENYKKQIIINQESHKRDIDELNAKIAEQEETKRELQLTLQKLLHDLRELQNGHGIDTKEPIAAEIARMEQLLKEKRQVNKVLTTREVRISINN